MKNILLFSFGFLILFFACRENSGEKESTEKYAEITFESNTYDFGNIPYEGDGTCYFEFENTSDVPLLINKVNTSCGCTSTEWPKEPVEPGEDSRIGVKYNTKLKGRFRKTVTVYSNTTGSPHRLFIEGNVVE